MKTLFPNQSSFQYSIVITKLKKDRNGPILGLNSFTV